ncbi:MAG TPA: hypothetical protein VHE59_11575 [Mucilaginibacter sp.]|nr:hypothetical protein [Mucilaginibacter sp.]
MKMQDKELDDLFRDKLENFEAEPSESVWTGIDTTINGRSRNKYLLPLLGVAASIVVLVTAGLLFIPRNNKNNGYVQPKNRIARRGQAPSTKKPAPQPEIKPTAGFEESEVAVTKKTERYMKTIAQKPTAQEPAQKVTGNKPLSAEEPVLATVTPKQEQVKPVITTIPDNSQIVKPNAKIDSAATLAVTKPAVVVKQSPVQQPAAPTAKKHGIHNFGDLVNVVMAKVDKRKDKAIEFSDDEDDEATLTAVNIGPIKIRRLDKSER